MSILADKIQPAEVYDIEFKGKYLLSNIYLYSLKIHSHFQSKENGINEMNLLNITEFYSVMKSAGLSKEKMFEKNRIARVVFQS